MPDERARNDDLRSYHGQDVILTLPGAVTVFDVEYLAVFNQEIQDSLGHVAFNVSGSRIPPALGQTRKPGWWFEVPVQTTAPDGNGAKGNGGGNGGGPAGEADQEKGGDGSQERYVPFNHDFQVGTVNLTLPLITSQSRIKHLFTSQLPNCRELLGRKIRLLWLNQGQHIYFRVKVHMGKEQFAAVGIAADG